MRDHMELGRRPEWLLIEEFFATPMLATGCGEGVESKRERR
jgi:hypothetical protein